MALDAFGLPVAQTAGRVKVTAFTATGTSTYRQSTQLLYAWIRLVGGGGGGANGAGGGGGGGGYSEKWLLAIDIGQPVTVTVGAGGSIGNPGSVSSFAARSGTLTGNGGAAGSGDVGGAGGTGSGGDLNISGGVGQSVPAGTTSNGGNSQLGLAPNLYGAGGGSTQAGANGIVLVYEFLGS